MVFCRSSVGLMLAIGLLGTAMPIVSLPEVTMAQSSVPAQSSIKQLLATAKQQYRRADFRGAIGTYEKVLSLGTAVAKVEALLQLAEIDLWTEQTPAAETKVQRALKLAKEQGDKQGEGRSLFMLAAAERYRQNNPKVIDLLNQALPILQSVGDREGEASIYLQLGVVVYEQDKFPQALEKIQLALTTAQSGNHQDVMVDCYNWLAKTQHRLKNTPQAITLIRQQQELSQLIGYRLGEYTGLSTIIELYEAAKQPALVMSSRQRQLEIARSAGNSKFQMEVLAMIGYDHLAQSDVYEKQKDYAQAETAAIEARRTFEQVLEISREKLPDRTAEGKALGHLAHAYMGQAGVAYQAGRYPDQLSYNLEALKLSKQSLELIKAGNPPPAELKSPKNLVALAHLVTLSSYNSTEQYEKAIAFGQAAQLAAKETGNSKKEEYISSALHLTYQSIASADGERRRYPEAIAAAREAIKYAIIIKDSDSEINHRINLIAAYYIQQGRFDRTLEESTLALKRSREVSNSDGVIGSLMFMAISHKQLGNYSEALKLYQEALALSKQNNEQVHGKTIILNLAALYADQGDYPQAKRLMQESFEVEQRLWKQYAQGVTIDSVLALCERHPRMKKSQYVCQNPGKLPTGNDLNLFKYLIDATAKSGRLGMAIGYQNRASLAKTQGDYQTGLQLNQQALDIFTELKDSDRIASALIGIAAGYSNMGEYQKAYDLSQQALKIAQDNNNPTDEMSYSRQLGIIELNRGNLKAARKFLDRTLTLARETKDPLEESIALGVFAQYHRFSGNYAESLTLNQQALNHQESMGIKSSIVTTLIQIGEVYTDLGDYPQANHYHQQSLKLAQSIGDQSSIVYSTLKLAESHLAAKQFDSAKRDFQTTLELTDKIGLQREKGSALYGLGAVELAQSRTVSAIPLFQQALTLQRKIGAKPRQAMTLNLLGQAQVQLPASPTTETTLQEALTIARQVSDRGTEAQVLANLATLYAKQNQPELAIALYKQSISIYEDIRKGLAPLPQDQQQSYTKTVAQAYRELADLLLKSDRILEARQVIELLKLQELDDYSKNTRGEKSPLTFLKNETALLEVFNQTVATQYNSLTQVAQELETLRAKPQSAQTTARIQQLEKLQGSAENQTIAFLDRPDIKILIQQLKSSDKVPELEGDNIRVIQSNLQELAQSQQTAALVYPLILNDRLEIILVTPKAIVRRTVTAFDRPKFNALVLEVGQMLGSPNTDAKPAAQQLYQILIAPIAADLQAANINTIIYTPDQRLRSIPLGALHDGKEWLAQRFQISYLTSSAITNLIATRQERPKVLAGAISDQVATRYAVQIPNDAALHRFGGLPAGQFEIKAIQALIPESQILINDSFNSDRIRDRGTQFNMLHLATHGLFQLGQPEKSFILLGGNDRDGKNYATLQDLKSWNLRNIDLVTLSACQTAVVAENQDSQLGIMGIGYQVQSAGAKAAIASLWVVNDDSTALLMQAFYRHLAQGKPKSEALRLAQLDLINIKDDAAKKQAIANITTRFAKPITDLSPNASSQPKSSPNSSPTPGYAHPYYWAPFILIGNGR